MTCDGSDGGGRRWWWLMMEVVLAGDGACFIDARRDGNG
ncbi:hypothetical protein A2U01_0039826 [Trifolium medium]|uniref:Uncharacterized protein n=1 Tax=Trifolium medium TaxID=97028 RepID=A0A392Q2Y2_9FABA|nr:hypothetical protein [Trifolium medium]